MLLKKKVLFYPLHVKLDEEGRVQTVSLTQKISDLYQVLPCVVSLLPTAFFSILSLGKLFLWEKSLAAKSDKQKLGKAHSGKHAGCRFNQFTKHEWMGQTEDKFGSALKGRGEGGQTVGDHFCFFFFAI